LRGASCRGADLRGEAYVRGGWGDIRTAVLTIAVLLVE
jgi:hypothetical protein